jgi:hypothetical protein
VTDRPRAFFCVDHGTATIAASIVGRVAGRWRLLGCASCPATVAEDAVLGLLVARLRAADPALAADLGATGEGPAPAEGHAGRVGGDGLVDLALGPADLASVPWPRVHARSAAGGTLAILAPTERRRIVLAAAAVGSGWRVASASLERSDALETMAVALGRDVRAILVGAGSPPAPDERDPLKVLGPMVAAIAERRPEVAIVLAGAAAQHQAMIEAARGGPGSVVVLREGGGAGPSAEALRIVLDDLRGEPADSRRGIARATATIASVLMRRVETVEVGMSGGVRAAAGRWVGREDEPEGRTAIVAAAGLAHEEPDDELLDGVIGWATVPIDRPRLRDRLRELWLAPWAEAHGEGALLRLTAARAALQRLVQATPEFDELGSPDLLVIAGGVWAVAPTPAVAMAVMDVVRRSGVTQLVLDHARILGPIGTIGDDAERAALLSDLVDDILVPLGTSVMPQGLRAGRFLGRAVVHRAGAPSVDHELVAGRLVTLDVPPGELGSAELEFRDGVVLGGRGRRFAVDVAGGMAGVVVDLRDIPLRLPDRLERRRELLAAWQQPLWSPLEA